MPIVVTDETGVDQEVCPAACIDGLFDPDNMSQEEIDRICNLFECGPLDIEALATALFLLCDQLNNFCDPVRDLETGDVVHICSNDETYGVTYRGPKRPAWFLLVSDYFSGSTQMTADNLTIHPSAYNPDGYLSLLNNKTVRFNESGFVTVTHQPGLETEGGFFTSDMVFSSAPSGSTFPNFHITLPPQEGSRHLVTENINRRVTAGTTMEFTIFTPSASTSRTCGESTILFFPDR